MKTRRHQLVITVTFDKPVTETIAIGAFNEQFRGQEEYLSDYGERRLPSKVKLGAVSRLSRTAASRKLARAMKHAAALGRDL